jgi:tRNA (adenine22-N1)-methyltransferase
MTDISAPSLEKGVKNAKNAGVADKISAYCTNGTLGVPLDNDTDIIIAGMGGELIAQILDQDVRLKNGKFRFILQPMSKAEALREYLAENGFEITAEEKTEAVGRVYAVISCRYVGKTYELTFKDRFLGYGFDESRPLDRKYAEKILNAFNIKLKGLEAAEFKDTAEIEPLKSYIFTLQNLLK